MYFLLQLPFVALFDLVKHSVAGDIVYFSWFHFQRNTV